ncbi:replication initiation and membrane attachment family protein [Enterococcus dispar]|uniref:replication initiation and membrane attachment family protein n=1 Tax=Enterococcus dispar TaxID=44009 RepID=UPI00288F990F|nr:DnaD domain protein [Enterococcus dispar]MDT2706623.1 DnaD domain protein [Enterococcus dispar]
MEYAYEANLQPKTLYEVKKSVPLTSEGQKSLVNLYQPIIGADALALYFCLIQDFEDTQEKYTHLELLNALDMGMTTMKKAKKRLEGIGLLKTYYKEQPEVRFLYVLTEPLTPQEFLKDELMAFLLVVKVGQNKFRQLNRRFKPVAIQTEGYQEVSTKFGSVYTFSQSEYQANQSVVEAATSNLQSDKTTLPLDDKQLNWPLLRDLATKKFINPAQLTDTLKKSLILYHEMFGYDELQLTNLMAEAVALTDGTIDERKLKNVVYKESQNLLPTKKQTTPNYQDDEQIRRKNTLLAQGFTEADWQTIRESERLAPMEYLTALKAAKGGYVTKNEEWLLTDLVSKSPLPIAVINILLNYLLVVQNKAQLPQALTNQIANDWSQNKFTTPEEAILYVRTTVKEKQVAKEQRKKTNGRLQNIVKKEDLPDWSKNQASSDPSRKAEIDKMMEEYFNDEEGEK